MLLDESGLKIAEFDPVLASVLGNTQGEEGCNLLAVALEQGRNKVHLRDWLYCLALRAGTEVNRRLIEDLGKSPDKFVRLLENGLEDDEDDMGVPPSRLTKASVSPSVLQMLDRVEQRRREISADRIVEPLLDLALLETVDEPLKDLLVLWAGADRIGRFKSQLRAKLMPVKRADIFVNGKLNEEAFGTSGRALCRRMVEDAASLGAKRITTRHLLYTLLGNQSGLLARALTVRSVDVKNELHATLARELTKPGRKRSDDFQLTPETTFEALIEILRLAHQSALERQTDGISEYDVHRVFVEKQGTELTRLFPPDKPLDLKSLQYYLESSEPDEEEEEPSTKRYTVREIEEQIKRRICGQEAAVDRVVPWIKRLRFGLPRDGRPAAVFLFLGPTGAGKTQLAKELAKFVFGDEDMMIFLEMGQFKTKESMSGFIGASPGYVGYGEGKLTNGLGDKPECVVLFDEIEKADSQVFDTLLRFADEGVISDPAGPVRDGRKCIIIMTTNAGQSWLRDHLKNHPKDREDPESLSKQLFEAAMQELADRGFRPEFLGRVDERITFLPFTLETCRKIVDGDLDRELEKFRTLKNITIDVPSEVRDILAQKAYERSGEEGARGAPRAINDWIVTPAIDLLSGSESHDATEPKRLIASQFGIDMVKLEVLQ